MTNALATAALIPPIPPAPPTLTAVAPLEGPDRSPAHGDVVLGPQPEGSCLLAQHPGAWQLWFGSHAAAVAVAMRFCALNGTRMWVRTATRYEPMGAEAIPAGDMG